MKNNSLLSLALFTLLILSTAHAEEQSVKKYETDYVKEYCRGTIEYILPDRTRVDCLTHYFAVEYDYARKWAEAVGQAQYYAKMTGKQPAVVLIVDSSKGEERFVERAKLAGEYSGLEVWTIER